MRSEIINNDNQNQLIEINPVQSQPAIQSARAGAQWNFPRGGKLSFYLFTMGMAILGFISSMGLWPIFDAVVGSVAAGMGIVGAAGYSIAKNYGVYDGDGKQKGNIQLIQEIEEMKKDRSNNIRFASGQRYMRANIIMNVIAGLIALATIALNIPAKLDSDRKNIWWLGFIATFGGAIATCLVVIAHELAALKLREIQDNLSNELEKIEKDEQERIVNNKMEDLTEQLKSKEQQSIQMALKNKLLEDRLDAATNQLNEKQTLIDKSQLSHKQVKEFLDKNMKHWTHKQLIYSAHDEKIYVDFSLGKQKFSKLLEKLHSTETLKADAEHVISELEKSKQGSQSLFIQK